MQAGSHFETKLFVININKHQLAIILFGWCELGMCLVCFCYFLTQHFSFVLTIFQQC